MDVTADSNDFLKQIDADMASVVTYANEELSKIKTGKPNPDIIKNIKINNYNSLVPLYHLASITIFDFKTLLVSPFNKSLIGNIESAIMKSGLNLNPQIHGNSIKIIFPPLTEETRKELVKLVKKKKKKYKTQIRNIRRDKREDLKSLEKKSVSKNLLDQIGKEIDHITNIYITKITNIGEQKEKAIMTL